MIATRDKDGHLVERKKINVTGIPRILQLLI